MFCSHPQREITLIDVVFHSPTYTWSCSSILRARGIFIPSYRTKWRNPPSLSMTWILSFFMSVMIMLQLESQHRPYGSKLLLLEVPWYRKRSIPPASVTTTAPTSDTQMSPFLFFAM